MSYQIKKWSEYQGYDKRGPRWLKLHLSLINDPAWIALPVESRALLPVLWIVAANAGTDGIIPSDTRLLSILCHVPEAEIKDGLPALIHNGLLIPDDSSRATRDSVAPVAPTVSGEESRGRGERETKQEGDAARRRKLESEGWRLAADIAKVTDEDPTAVIARASTGNGRFQGSRKLRLQDMTEQRLELSVIDLREEWAKVKPKEASAGDRNTELTKEFYAEHGPPQQLAAECANYVRQHFAALTDREGVDKWLVMMGAPQHVRIEVIRRALSILEKANATNGAVDDGNGAPAVPEEAKRAGGGLLRSSQSVPGARASPAGQDNARPADAVQGAGRPRGDR